MDRDLHQAMEELSSALRDPEASATLARCLEALEGQEGEEWGDIFVELQDSQLPAFEAISGFAGAVSHTYERMHNGDGCEPEEEAIYLQLERGGSSQELGAAMVEHHLAWHELWELHQADDHSYLSESLMDALHRFAQAHMRLAGAVESFESAVTDPSSDTKPGGRGAPSHLRLHIEGVIPRRKADWLLDQIHKQLQGEALGQINCTASIRKRILTARLDMRVSGPEAKVRAADAIITTLLAQIGVERRLDR